MVLRGFIKTNVVPIIGVEVKTALSFLCLFLFTTCASPRLVKLWRDEMTLCCSDCSASAWNYKLSDICKGKAYRVSVDERRRVSGWTTVKPPRNEMGRTSHPPTVTTKEECRAYVCNGRITSDERKTQGKPF